MIIKPARVACVVFAAAALVAGSAGAVAAKPVHKPARGSSAARFTPGAAGVGDTYFPQEGNGGYDVGHYTVDIGYSPDIHWLKGTMIAQARATQNLSRFDLDLSGMTVRSVEVNGHTARFHRAGQELQITPSTGLVNGSDFTVQVIYTGTPRTIKGSPIVFGADYGWQYTPDGAFVGDEPNGASTWFPCNDHPQDKATFTFNIGVPKTRRAIANGDLSGVRTVGDRSYWHWNETSPMPTYLATVDIGKWYLRSGKTPSGIKEITAVDPALNAENTHTQTFERTGRVTDYWAKLFGPYPFTSTGAIVDNVPDVGFSLETQTRPLYGFVPDTVTLAHELSHEWFGDSVSVHMWRDIWLNEGFATFAERMIVEHNGGQSTYSSFKNEYSTTSANDSFWKQAIAAPGRDTMFSQAVYDRGGMTLAALRHRMGDHLFFTLLRDWAAQHKYGNATTSQFEALAAKVYGKSLTKFFDAWLWSKTKPASFDGA
jgi:aminopeptidase N